MSCVCGYVTIFLVAQRSKCVWGPRNQAWHHTRGLVCYPRLISTLPATSIRLIGARLWLQSIHPDGKSLPELCQAYYSPSRICTGSGEIGQAGKEGQGSSQGWHHLQPRARKHTQTLEQSHQSLRLWLRNCGACHKCAFQCFHMYFRCIYIYIHSRKE